MLHEHAVQERSKGLLVLVGSAVAAGVIMEVRRDRTPAAPSASAPIALSAPESSVALPPPRVATRAELAATLATLEARARGPAGDDTHPWALAHGLVAFGPRFQTQSGKRAVDVMASFAEQRGVGGKNLWLFPRRKDASLVEPHKHLLIKTMLESGVGLDEKFTTSTGAQITLRTLVQDARSEAALPADDTAWHDAAWTLSAMHSADELGLTAPAGALSTDALAVAALARLETDNHVVTSYAGPLETAFEPGSSLREAKAKKTGIYGHSCGGMHLVQAVLSTNARADAARKSRTHKQLGVLLFRYESERLTLIKLLQAHPDQGLLLRVQRLKLYGHLVETLTLARSLGYLDESTEGGKKLWQLALHAAADLVDVVRELDAGGVYLRLDAIRAEREQTYLDLVGDACHGIRGLRRAIAILDGKDGG